MQILGAAITSTGDTGTEMQEKIQAAPGLFHSTKIFRKLNSEMEICKQAMKLTQKLINILLTTER